MRLVAEYRQLAQEDRKLLHKVAGQKDKQALELMARAWDSIAIKREDRILGTNLLFDDPCRSAQNRPLVNIRNGYATSNKGACNVRA